MEQKEVKIVGLSISEDFGGVKAVELGFDIKNRLTIIKGEVGSGKTTLNRAMRLTTQGSGTLKDKSLYGDIDITTELDDNGLSIFVGCKTIKDELTYFLYSVDKDGKKVKDVVVDGVRATPASYLKSLQTALTWRLDELTSESATTQRNILLELYSQELEKQGVIFDKNHPKYVGSIIDRIEKVKATRNHLDMKRKEVGGIADDLQKKGIKFNDRKAQIDLTPQETKVSKLEAQIVLAKENVEQAKTNKLNELKAAGSQINIDLHLANDKIKDDNKDIERQTSTIIKIKAHLMGLELSEEIRNNISEIIEKNVTVLNPHKTELKFNSKGSCKSKPKDFEGEIKTLLKKYKNISNEYRTIKGGDAALNTEKLEGKLKDANIILETAKSANKEAEAINAFHDWRDANDVVNGIKKDYYLKLTEIDTGVKGLHITPEFTTDENGDKIAKDNNIYLMYNGSYDTKYFHNEDKVLRKLSSYSGTQKPMICLLIQNYLLSKKPKILPYLWIDDVPLDVKTRKLLKKMAKELDLWLFVNWTGDFDKKQLKTGEILLQNGNVLLKE